MRRERIEKTPLRPVKHLIPFAAKVQHLLTTIWHGNVSRMAEDIGVSHASITLVLAARGVLPGKAFLVLCARPDVDLPWLFNQPTAEDRTASDDIDAAVVLMTLAKAKLAASQPKEETSGPAQRPEEG